MPPEPPQPRTADRTVYYTMKTSSRNPSMPSQGSSTTTHAAPGPQSLFSNKSTTPTASSPHFPFSVGQPYPPKLSPSAAPSLRLATPQHVGENSTARTPSPNYFGLIVEPTHNPQDTAMLPRDNWSPVTSSVRSFAAAIPKQLPLDANPEFEAFRRQADANRGRSGFNLSTSHFGLNNGSGVSSPAPMRPRPPRWHTHGSDNSSDGPPASRPAGPAPSSQHSQPQQTASAIANRTTAGVGGAGQPSATRMDIDNDASSLHDSAYVSGDSKRNSEASLNPPPFFNLPRQESPAQFDSPIDKRSSLSAVEDRHPRLSITQGRPDPPSPVPYGRQGRAETLPKLLSDSAPPALIGAAELRNLLLGPSADLILLLDIRSHQKYSTSRIQSSLNLCIPTTLLKRASFNLEKLQATFQSKADREKFANWRMASHIIVYHDTEKKDDVACINMLKKFTSEFYVGKACVLRGGFEGFSQTYPELLDRRSSAERSGPPAQSRPGWGANADDTSMTRVIGGFTLPAGSDAAPNAFFSNIRQNTELVNGVGQMDIAVPTGLDFSALPEWLNRATEARDHGKRVSDKFLGIERKEQARMHRAYTSISAQQCLKPGSGGSPSGVQLSGIEQGAKNRYNNILPFEHARVHLGGKLTGECDYINASHITTNRSHKRYIASQGPLPATFEDFWSMIWDQDVRVIVMLTAEEEGGQLKCHPYWRGKEFGQVKLRALSEKKVSLDMDKRHPGLVSPKSLHNKQSSKPNLANPSTPGPQSTQPPLPSASEGRRRANTTANPLKPEPSHGGFGRSDKSQPPPQNGSGEVPYVIVRKFALSHSAHPFAPIREITHLHYPSWPDFGAPAQPSHLLALVELANVMQRTSMPLDVPSTIAASSEREKVSKLSSQNSGNGRDFAHRVWKDEPVSDAQARPMLVHCSAGCGRTGTFCTVDSVVDMLKRQRQRLETRKETAKAAAAARRGRASRRRDIGVKRKLEQRDSEGDVSMAGSAPGSASRPTFSRLDDGNVSPRTTSFQGAVDAISSSFQFSSPPPKFPSLASISASPSRGARGSATSASASASGSEEGGMTPYYSSSSSDEHQHSPTDGDDTDGGLDTSWIDDETFDLVAGTVEDFRGQRLSMVQTIRQFVLCYETVLEWVARLQERTHDEDGSLPMLTRRSRAV